MIYFPLGIYRFENNNGNFNDSFQIKLSDIDVVIKYFLLEFGWQNELQFEIKPE